MPADNGIVVDVKVIVVVVVVLNTVTEAAAELPADIDTCGADGNVSPPEKVNVAIVEFAAGVAEGVMVKAKELLDSPEITADVGVLEDPAPVP